MTQRHYFKLPTFALCTIVLMAFLLHLFLYSSLATVYAGMVLCLALVFTLSKRTFLLRGYQSLLLLLWICSLAVIIFNYLWIYQNDAVVMDIAILFSGFLMMFSFSVDSNDYNKAISLIRGAALVFAVSVFLQLLATPVYLAVIKLFPPGLAKAVVSPNLHGDLRGFSINRGFTANYILTGMFAAVSARLAGVIKNRKLIIWLAVLGAAFILTEKRGPLLFAVLAALICYLISSKLEKKVRILLTIFVGGCILLVAFVEFQDLIVQIPGMGRIVSTFNGLSEGEDITSGRTRLYMWAITQFKENPVFGMGWGKYRTTTAGVATYSKSLDVHNVYLQLLCETGIVGFAFFVTAFALSWIMTKKAYCSCLNIKDDATAVAWKGALFFSLIFQTYFLLYCITGNPLYDQYYQIMYTFACSITLGYRFVSASGDKDRKVIES